MDNESVSKFISTIHDITAQQQFLIGIQDMINRINETPTHIFDEMLHCLAMLKTMVCDFRHVSDREVDRKLQREWLER
jgi:hypothetical protein